MSYGGSATGGIPAAPGPSGRPGGGSDASDPVASAASGCSMGCAALLVIAAIVLFGFASESADVSNSYGDGEDGGLGSLGEIVGGVGLMFILVAVGAVAVAVRARKGNQPFSHVKSPRRRPPAGNGEGAVAVETPAATPATTPVAGPTAPQSATSVIRAWTAGTRAVVAIHVVQGLMYLAISFQQSVDIEAPWGVFYVFTKVGLLEVGNDPRPHAQLLGLLLIGSAWWYTKSDKRASIAVIAVQGVVLAGCLRTIYLFAGGGGAEYRDGYDWQLSSLLFTAASATAIVVAASSQRRRSA